MTTRQEKQKIRQRERYRTDPTAQINSGLKSQYGIMVWDWLTMILEQDHLCKICGSPLVAGRGKIAIDHCHATGKVRGLLCHQCNIGLGAFRDSTETMQKAIEYLLSTSPS